ncbi:MAG TPA: hypothetical protein PLA27_17130 [Anaerolineales bacterium]|jgi:hypothetical protein|nr:hypothetical protein [Anaerolineales bacterium]
MANDYTSSTDAFADISEGSYTTSDYPVMSDFVTFASRQIDAAFGRVAGFFYPTTDEVTYYYNGSGRATQYIDEFVSISSVAVAESGGLSSTDYTTWVEGTDYITYPYNASALGKPFTALGLVDYAGTKGAFYSGQKSVKVVGVAGYSASPPAIVAKATKIQAVQWFMKAKMGYQMVNSGGETASALNYALDDNVLTILKPIFLEFS